MDQTICASNAVSKIQAFPSKNERPAQHGSAVCGSNLDFGRAVHLKHLEVSMRTSTTKSKDMQPRHWYFLCCYSCFQRNCRAESCENKHTSNPVHAFMSYLLNNKQPQNALFPACRSPFFTPTKTHEPRRTRATVSSQAIHSATIVCAVNSLYFMSEPTQQVLGPAFSYARPRRRGNSQLYKSPAKSDEQMPPAERRISGVQPQPRVGAQLVDSRPFAWLVQQARLNEIDCLRKRAQQRYTGVDEKSVLTLGTWLPSQRVDIDIHTRIRVVCDVIPEQLSEVYKSRNVPQETCPCSNDELRPRAAFRRRLRGNGHPAPAEAPRTGASRSACCRADNIQQAGVHRRLRYRQKRSWV